MDVVRRRFAFEFAVTWKQRLPELDGGLREHARLFRFDTESGARAAHVQWTDGRWVRAGMVAPWVGPLREYVADLDAVGDASWWRYQRDLEPATDLPVREAA